MKDLLGEMWFKEFIGVIVFVVSVGFGVDEVEIEWLMEFGDFGFSMFIDCSVLIRFFFMDGDVVGVFVLV